MATKTQPKMNKVSLKEILDRKGVKYTSKSTVSELEKLVEGTKKKASTGRSTSGEY